MRIKVIVLFGLCLFGKLLSCTSLPLPQNERLQEEVSNVFRESDTHENKQQEEVFLTESNSLQDTTTDASSPQMPDDNLFPDNMESLVEILTESNEPNHENQNTDEQTIPAPNFEPQPLSKGGSITFQNVGAAGWWPRRILRSLGHADCNVRDEMIRPWGGAQEHCCLTQHAVTKPTLSPFDQEMTLLLRGPMKIKQLAVFQPVPSAQQWSLVSFWDKRFPQRTKNLQFSHSERKNFDGNIENTDKLWWVMQQEAFFCGPQSVPYCPTSGPPVQFRGWNGSKLFVLLASLPFEQGDGWLNAPWIGLSASELIRDGAGKFHPCNCYTKTPAVGDGCGEINVFETVNDANNSGNPDFMSTGVRSFQVGHLGGSICSKTCQRSQFPVDVDLIDACKRSAMSQGAVLSAQTKPTSCPVWIRPKGERYFVFLLHEASRTIHISMLHPLALPTVVKPFLPVLQQTISSQNIQQLLQLRVP